MSESPAATVPQIPSPEGPSPAETLWTTGAGGRPKVTPSEMAVWKLLSLGFRTKEIASLLEKKPKTIDNQRDSLLTKLGLSSSILAARFAIAEGISPILDRERWPRPT